MRLIAAVSLALLVVLAGCGGGTGTPTAASPGTAPSATPSTTDAPSPTASPTPTFDYADPESDRLGWEDGYWYNESLDIDQSDGLSETELDHLVAREMARVEHIRQLEFNETVPVNVMTRAEYQNRTAGNGSSASSAALSAFDNTKFEALLLVNESTDSLRTQSQNRGSSVLGFYSPAREEIVIIVSGDAEVTMGEFTLAHELTHALQDQHFNLSKYHGRTRDGVNANNGLIEGDAKYVEHMIRRRCNGDGAWNGTCARDPASGSGGGSLANMGVYFIKYQPYADGPNFIRSVRDRGGWEAVNEVYDDPPASTEQVIDPSAYPDDAPTNVSLTDQSSDAWTRVRPPGRPDYAEVGQAGVMSMLVYPLYDSGGRTQIIKPREWLNYTASGELNSFDPLNYDHPYAAGWDGDKMFVYQNGDGETAYVWRLTWDSTTDASEFRTGYLKVLDYWGAEKRGDHTYVIPEGNGFADAFYVTVDGDTVTITNAPTVDGLSEVRSSASA